MSDSAERPLPPPNRQRHKAQLSCNPCRHRKLKCDRQHPCERCTRRGAAKACTYADSASPSSERRHRLNLQDRISELENLVTNLLRKQSSKEPLSPTTPSDALTTLLPKIQTPKINQSNPEFPADPGSLKLGDSRIIYVQSEHWESILTKIKGLKEDLVTENDAPAGPYLLYGANRHATREEILAAIPSRSVADRLLAHLFSFCDIVPFVLHSGKFLREYEKFWENPSAAPIPWIALMFSMMCLSAQLQPFNDVTSGSLLAELAGYVDRFREKTVQCLVLAKYTKGGPYTLETLTLYLAGEILLLKDSSTDSWILTGMVVHLAMRMGYHRDPDHFPGMSPFAAEMRRRIWAMVVQFDLAMSSEIGLPVTSAGTPTDTKEPRNLLDTDFDEDTTQLPPSRPETELTPILHLIARRRLLSVLGQIPDLNTNTRPASPEDIMRIDKIVEEARAAIPAPLTWRPMNQSITDSPNIVMQRLYLEAVYHRGKILLHRRNLINGTPDSFNGPEANSVCICLDAAVNILKYQEVLDAEAQPDGRLYQVRWKINHIANHDILLATSILCLYLQMSDSLDLVDGAARAVEAMRREEIRRRLKISQRIWQRLSANSVEAQKAARALSIVLEPPEVPITDNCGIVGDNMFAEFEPLPFNGYGANPYQYYPSGFYSPMTFFDNMLESQGASYS